MDKNKQAPGEEVELEQVFAVVYIPTSTCELTLNAKVFLDGGLHTVQTVLDFDKVRDAIHEAELGYIPDDAVFTLTEKGKEYADMLREMEDLDAD